MKNIKGKPAKYKLDLACGTATQTGFIGVDIWHGADVVCNLENFPWPFDDNSVDEIFCSHYIEHVPDLVSFANELYRILKPGAKAVITAPYYTSIRAWQDPTHVRAISERTFWYFNKKYRNVLGVDHYPITADFDCECCFDIDPEWRDKGKEELDFAMKHYFNVVNNIRVILTKRKPENEKAVILAQQAQKSWERGHRNKAYVLAMECLAIEPKFDALIIAGEYEFMRENYEVASRRFREAVCIDGHSCEGHAGLVRSFVKMGRRVSAKKYIAKLAAKSSELSELLEMYL